MPTDTTPITEERKPAVLAEDEQVTLTCPDCHKTMVRTIEAGTSQFAARLMRKLTVMLCSPCAARAEAEAAEEERLRLRRGREQSCGLPRELRGLTWDSYSTERRGSGGALRAAQAWAAGTHEKRGVMLVGGVGVGKTRLAATALWQLLDRRPATFVNVAELIVRLTASFGDKDRAEALRTLTGKGALVLDDLDKISPSMTVLSHLYTAIDGRVQAGAPLFVTTNLTPQQLRDRLARPGRGEDADQRTVAADAIMSRLLGHCTVHKIDGADGRRA